MLPTPHRGLTNSLDVTKERLMTHSTPICSISHCERGQYKYSKQGYCESHHRRNAEYGHPIRPCRTCGRDMVGLGKSSNYCSDECKICTIDGCDRKIPQVACAGCITSESGRAQRLISIAKRAAESLSSTAGRLNTATPTVALDAKWMDAVSHFDPSMDIVACTK